MILKRVLIAFCIALATSSGLTLLLGRHLRTQAPKTHDVVYYAAARAVEAGELLRPADIEPIAWPEHIPLEGAAAQGSAVVGRTTLVAIGKGQPILGSYLSAPGAGPGLAAHIPTGMRALALKSDDVVGVGGFLNPGSHVDVLVTSHPSGQSEPSTTTALQNAEVIATGQRVQPDPSGKPESVTVVTLLLTPGDAERAVLASTQGSIQFVLRNSGDAALGKTTPVQLASLYGLVPQAPKPAVVERKPVPAKLVIRPEPGIETFLDEAQVASAAPRGSR